MLTLMQDPKWKFWLITNLADICMFRFHFYKPLCVLHPKIKSLRANPSKCQCLELANSCADATAHHVLTEPKDAKTRRQVWCGRQWKHVTTMLVNRVNVWMTIQMWHHLHFLQPNHWRFQDKNNFAHQPKSLFWFQGRKSVMDQPQLKTMRNNQRNNKNLTMTRQNFSWHRMDNYPWTSCHQWHRITPSDHQMHLTMTNDGHCAFRKALNHTWTQWCPNKQHTNVTRRMMTIHLSWTTARLKPTLDDTEQRKSWHENTKHHCWSPETRQRSRQHQMVWCH